MQPLFADCPVASRVIAIVIAFALGVLVALPADAQTIGVHTWTWHDDSSKRDDTAGLSVRFDAANQWEATFGAYQNSIKLLNGGRITSFYAGATRQWGRWGLMLAAVSGYKRHRVDRECTREDLALYPRDRRVLCWQEVGRSRSDWAALAVPSVAITEVRQFIGVTPRLTLVGIKRPAIHLSMEWAR